MKYNLTAVFKSKERLKDCIITRKHENIELDIKVRFDDKFGGYYIINDKSFNQEIIKRLNLTEEKNIHVNLLTDYLGEEKRDLSLVVEILVPNKIIRSLKIERVLDTRLV